nr:hypothetical protein [Tanacetum cinerariifolium]
MTITTCKSGLLSGGNVFQNDLTGLRSVGILVAQLDGYHYTRAHLTQWFEVVAISDIKNYMRFRPVFTDDIIKLGPWGKGDEQLSYFQSVAI